MSGKGSTHGHGRSAEEALELRAAKGAPGSARACMDGFAVRAADTFGASSYEPVSLDVRAEALLPGQAAPPSPLGAGQAVRIMTGAALPPGADAVVPVERVTVVDLERGEIG